MKKEYTVSHDSISLDARIALQHELARIKFPSAQLAKNIEDRKASEPSMAVPILYTELEALCFKIYEHVRHRTGECTYYFTPYVQENEKVKQEIIHVLTDFGYDAELDSYIDTYRGKTTTRHFVKIKW